MTDHIVAAWKEDIDVRTNGLEQRPANGYAVRVHEISPGVVYDSAGVKITAIPVLHGSWKEAYGYRVDTPDRSIVLSGDTRPSPAIEQAARGVDVLIHEAYPESPSITQRDSAFARYRRAFHTSAAELGRLAAAAKPKLLVLYHHATPADGGAAVIATIRGAGYQGRVIFGKALYVARRRRSGRRGEHADDLRSVSDGSHEAKAGADRGRREQTVSPVRRRHHVARSCRRRAGGRLAASEGASGCRRLGDGWLRSG
jgi:hypothetical protein